MVAVMPTSLGLELGDLCGDSGVVQAEGYSVDDPRFQAGLAQGCGEVA